MGTATVIRRGKAIRNSEGDVTGYEKGTVRTKVTTDSSRRQRIDVGTGKAYNKTTRTTDSKGKITTSAKTSSKINAEINKERTKQNKARTPKVTNHSHKYKR